MSIDYNTSQEEKQVNEPSIQRLFPSEIPTGFILKDKQEETRSNIAIILIRILAGTVFSTFFMILSLVIVSISITEEKSDNLKESISLTKELIALILTAETGLVGTALGYYFGSKNSN